MVVFMLLFGASLLVLVRVDSGDGLFDVDSLDLAVTVAPFLFLLFTMIIAVLLLLIFIMMMVAFSIMMSILIIFVFMMIVVFMMMVVLMMIIMMVVLLFVVVMVWYEVEMGMFIGFVVVMWGVGWLGTGWVINWLLLG